MVSPIGVNPVTTSSPQAETGLSTAAAIAQIHQDGHNELPSAQSRSILAIARGTLQDPIFLLLVGGGVIYLFLGDLQEALILLGFVFFLMAISLYQEGKTEHAIAALRDLSSPRALVIRDGQRQGPRPCYVWTKLGR
jgi:P-type Ca2+ transporter type 2C